MILFFGLGKFGVLCSNCSVWLILFVVILFFICCKVIKSCVKVFVIICVLRVIDLGRILFKN